MKKLEIWLVNGQLITLKCRGWELDESAILCEHPEGHTCLVVAADRWTHFTAERVADED